MENEKTTIGAALAMELSGDQYAETVASWFINECPLPNDRIEALLRRQIGSVGADVMLEKQKQADRRFVWLWQFRGDDVYQEFSVSAGELTLIGATMFGELLKIRRDGDQVPEEFTNMIDETSRDTLIIAVYRDEGADFFLHDDNAGYKSGPSGEVT